MRSITTPTLGERLLASAQEIIDIENGDAAAPREYVYDGPVLIAVQEDGTDVWRLDSVRVAPSVEDFTTIRTELRQSQEGMAELLGVGLGTVRNWDQGRRTPRGPAAILIELAARRPDVLMETRGIGAAETPTGRLRP